MIVALRNQKGGVRKTALALRLGGQGTRQGKRLTRIEPEQRARKREERLSLIGLAWDALRREAPEPALLADRTIIHGWPTEAAPLRSMPIAADLVPIVAQPSPFDGWAAAEMLRLVTEPRVFRSTLFTRFVFRWRPARSLIAHGAARNLADHDLPTLASHIAEHVIFAEAASSRPLEQRRIATRRLRGTRDRGARRGERKTCPRRCGSATAASRLVRAMPRPALRAPATEAGSVSARLAVDNRPALRGRVTTAAFQGSKTIAGAVRVIGSRTNSPRAMEAPL